MDDKSPGMIYSILRFRVSDKDVETDFDPEYIGLYLNERNAVRALTDNEKMVFDSEHRLVCIEELPEGLITHVHGKLTWFHKSDSGNIEQCKQPDWINSAMGLDHTSPN